jgi:hypothetical protein
MELAVKNGLSRDPTNYGKPDPSYIAQTMKTAGMETEVLPEIHAANNPQITYNAVKSATGNMTDDDVLHVYVVSHGYQEGIMYLGTNEASFTTELSKIANDSGKYVVLDDYSCGSGRCTSPQFLPESAIAEGGKFGVVGQSSDAEHSTWTGIFKTDYATISKNFDAIDTDKDNIITFKELNAWPGSKNLNISRAGSNDAPIMARPGALSARNNKPQPSKGQCIVVTPGPSQKYGALCGQPGIFINETPIGDCIDPSNIFNHDNPEDYEANQRLRQAGYFPLQADDLALVQRTAVGYTPQQKTSGNQVDEAKKGAGYIKNTIIPTREQAIEFINNDGVSGYTINGLRMRPGTYIVGVKTAKSADDKDVNVSEDCIFSETTQEQKDNAGKLLKNNNLGNSNTNNNGGCTNGGCTNNTGNTGSSNLGNSSGNKSGLAKTLGSLLQNFLKNNNNTNGNNANNAITCPVTSAPVCGADGQTYANSCFATKYNVIVSHAGACGTKTVTTATTSGDSTLNSLLQQAVNSGVPQSLLSNIVSVIINSMIQVYSGGGAATGITVVP